MSPTDGKRYYPRLKHVRERRYAYIIDRVNFTGNGVFVLEKHAKQIPPARPDHPGGKFYNVDGVTKVPYRLPELIERSHPQQLILSWAKARSTHFARWHSRHLQPWQRRRGRRRRAPRGADVILLPDNDDPVGNMAQLAPPRHSPTARVRISPARSYEGNLWPPPAPLTA